MIDWWFPAVKNIIVSLLQDIKLAAVSVITSWHIGRQLLEGKTEKSNIKGDVEHGGECLSVCTFLHPWVSVYLCVQLWLEREKIGGWSVPGERFGLCPTAFGTKALLLLCMLAVSVGDKVWSWKIKSAPGNEAHAKGLHRKLNLSSQVSFISKCFIPSIVLLHYQAPLLS